MGDPKIGLGVGEPANGLGDPVNGAGDEAMNEDGEDPKNGLGEDAKKEGEDPNCEVMEGVTLPLSDFAFVLMPNLPGFFLNVL